MNVFIYAYMYAYIDTYIFSLFCSFKKRKSKYFKMNRPIKRFIYIYIYIFFRLFILFLHAFPYSCFLQRKNV